MDWIINSLGDGLAPIWCKAIIQINAEPYLLNSDP